MGGLSLLLGDSGGLPLVAGSNGEEAMPGGSDRMSGGWNCHPGVGSAVQKQTSVFAGNHAPDIGNEPMGVTPLAGRLPLRPVERAHAREH